MESQKQALNHRLRNKTLNSLPTLADQQDIVRGDMNLLLPVAHAYPSWYPPLPDAVTASEAPVMS